MRKLFTVATLVAALSLIAASFGSAGGPSGAGKSPIYDSGFAGWTCPTGAVTTTVGTFGFVVLNTDDSGDLIAQVVLQHVRPNATYFVFVNQFPGDCPTPATGTITTNDEGNGTGHFVEPRNPLATAFWISALTFGPPIAQGIHSRAVVLD
jgi:hypothetical protein